jgi:hypothetical protein
MMLPLVRSGNMNKCKGHQLGKEANTKGKGEEGKGESKEGRKEGRKEEAAAASGIVFIISCSCSIERTLSLQKLGSKCITYIFHSINYKKCTVVQKLDVSFCLLFFVQKVVAC